MSTLFNIFVDFISQSCYSKLKRKVGDTMLELYKNIKRLREELGLSQDALAKMTGYTDRSSIAKIEKGQVDLQQSKIELFANALSTTPASLMGWENSEESHTIAAHFEGNEFTEDELEDIKAYAEFVRNRRKSAK